MNWKSDLKLADLEDGAVLEITCRRCGLCRHEAKAKIMCDDFKDSYLDEVEKALRCQSRFCRGPVRIALSFGGKTEGFVGGMA
ncbi:MAG: hypothetical protein EKK42_32835 [Pseudonocardiaceae bacterium]|nr:MAG: hypothetical protein EKK42_32835 [Pseudonocardiaceae bacterium]